MFPLQLPSHLQDDGQLHHAYDRSIRVAVSERQLYFQILLPYKAEEYKRWTEFVYLDRIRAWEQQSLEVGYFQVAGLDIRHSGQWSEIEGVIPLESYLTEAQIQTALYLSGLRPGLYEDVLHFQKSDEFEDTTHMLPSLMSRLFCIVGQRLADKIESGKICALRILYHFIRGEHEMLTGKRTGTGFLELMLPDDDISMLIAEAEELAVIDEIHAAREMILDALPQHPESGRLLETMGNLCLRHDSPQRAMLFFQQALKDTRFLRTDLAYLGIAKAHIAQEQYEAALQALDKGLASNPFFLELALWKSHLLTDLGKLDEAFELLDVVEHRNANTRNLHLERGYTYLHAEQKRRALEEFRVESEKYIDNLEAIEKTIQLAEELGEKHIVERFNERKQALQDCPDGDCSEFMQQLEDSLLSVGASDIPHGELLLWLKSPDSSDAWDLEKDYCAECEGPSLPVDNSSFNKTPLVYGDCRVVYKEDGYCSSFRIPFQYHIWERAKELNERAKHSKVQVEREDEHIVFMFRIFPKPGLDVEEWIERWSMHKLPLLGELLEHREFSLSPSQCWDMLYRRLIVLICTHIQHEVEQGNYCPLVRFSRWIMEEEHQMKICQTEDVAVASCCFGEELPIGPEHHMDEWLNDLFSTRPSDDKKVLYLPEQYSLQDGMLASTFSMPTDKVPLDLKEKDEILDDIQKGHLVKALQAIHQHVLAFRCSPWLYDLKADIYHRLAQQPKAPFCCTHGNKELAKRAEHLAEQLRDSFLKTIL